MNYRADRAVITRRIACALLVSSFVAPPTVREARAQVSYPIKPVRLIVPFAAGSPIDVVARLLADKLATSLKQSFVVENRPGAGGNLGAEVVARAEPDGYTLGLTLDTVLTANASLYKSVRFDPVSDFMMIAAVAESGQMLVVHPSLGVDSVEGLIAQARSAGARREPMIYGSGGGNGTPGHLTMESFRQYASFDAVHLPFRGNPAMVMALVTGEIKLAFTVSAGVIEYVRAGKLRALGVSHAQRAVLAPEVPTIAELGHPDFVINFSQVLIAPREIPAVILEKLANAVRSAVREPDVEERLNAMDIKPVFTTGDELMRIMRRNTEHWTKVASAMPARLD